MMCLQSLPLYDVGSLRLSLDLHNPGNEAGIADYDVKQIELALVADVGTSTWRRAPFFRLNLVSRRGSGGGR